MSQFSVSTVKSNFKRSQDHLSVGDVVARKSPIRFQDCTTPTVYDIANTSTQLVLINSRKPGKFCHLRGKSRAEDRRACQPDPGRHFQLNTTPSSRGPFHTSCSLFDVPPDKGRTSRTESASPMSSSKSPILYDSPSRVNTARHVGCQGSRNSTPTLPKVCSLSTTSLDGEIHYNKGYLRRLTKVYDLENMKYLKEAQYTKLLAREVKRGFYGADELRRYRRYLDNARKTGNVNKAVLPKLRERRDSIFPLQLKASGEVENPHASNSHISMDLMNLQREIFKLEHGKGQAVPGHNLEGKHSSKKTSFIEAPTIHTPELDNTSGPRIVSRPITPDRRSLISPHRPNSPTLYEILAEKEKANAFSLRISDSKKSTQSHSHHVFRKHPHMMRKSMKEKSLETILHPSLAKHGKVFIHSLQKMMLLRRMTGESLSNKVDSKDHDEKASIFTTDTQNEYASSDDDDDDDSVDKSDKTNNNNETIKENRDISTVVNENNSAVDSQHIDYPTGSKLTTPENRIRKHQIVSLQSDGTNSLDSLNKSTHINDNTVPLHKNSADNIIAKVAHCNRDSQLEKHENREIIIACSISEVDYTAPHIQRTSITHDTGIPLYHGNTKTKQEETEECVLNDIRSEDDGIVVEGSQPNTDENSMRDRNQLTNKFTELGKKPPEEINGHDENVTITESSSTSTINKLLPTTHTDENPTLNTSNKRNETHTLLGNKTGDTNETEDNTNSRSKCIDLFFGLENPATKPTHVETGSISKSNEGSKSLESICDTSENKNQIESFNKDTTIRHDSINIDQTSAEESEQTNIYKDPPIEHDSSNIDQISVGESEQTNIYKDPPIEHDSSSIEQISTEESEQTNIYKDPLIEHESSNSDHISAGESEQIKIGNDPPIGHYSGIINQISVEESERTNVYKYPPIVRDSSNFGHISVGESEQRNICKDPPIEHDSSNIYHISVGESEQTKIGNKLTSCLDPIPAVKIIETQFDEQKNGIVAENDIVASSSVNRDPTETLRVGSKLSLVSEQSNYENHLDTSFEWAVLPA